VKVLLVFSFLISLGFSDSAFSAELKYDLNDFVKISGEQKLFVKWKKAEAGKPTAFLLNGLTYSTKQWDQFAFHLAEAGIGVVQYDMFGMGKTLEAYGPVQAVVPWESQVLDLKILARKLKIKGPLNLIGLSYGGGLAIGFSGLFPELTDNVFLLAPFTEPIESQDSWIRLQVATTRFWYPYNPYSDDELYDYFLKQNVYTTYPMAEPIVLENPYKLEATFRMVQGIRKLPTFDLIQKSAPKSLHLMIAGKDEYIPRTVHDSFWNQVPSEAKGTQIVLLQSKHKIPETEPKLSARWVSQILLGKIKNRGADQNYFADSRTGIASGPEGEIDLNDVEQKRK